MGKRRDIMYSYHKENCEDRFEFMYEHYYYYKTVLSSRKACTIYSIESYMRKEHWDEYFKLYNVQKREALISRVSASMDKGESIDYLICEEGLPESILEHYKDYLAMKIDFRIFSCALKSIGGKDEELLRRYILKEVDLTGIAEERTISYETAKGKVRDLKKLLKERTICYLKDEKAS